MPSAFICLGFFGRHRETVIGAESHSRESRANFSARRRGVPFPSS